MSPWARFGLGAVLVLTLGCQVRSNVGDDARGIDDDGDGFNEKQGDCDDGEDSVHPAAEELCDGLDNDCDDRVDQDGVCARVQQFDVQARADLLLVVDDTESVREERDRLAAAVDDLLEPLWQADHDVHVGLITSSVDDPAGAGVLHAFEGRRWVDRELDRIEASRWLQQVIDVPSGGNNWTEPRATLFAALGEEVDGVNAGFRRDNAYLAVLILTDEDDESGAPTFDDFASWLSVEVGLRRCAIHALVNTEGPGACDGGTYGADHLALVDLTQGTEASICADDYAPFLASVAQNTSLHAPPDTFRLAQPAVPESVAVDIRLPSGFTESLDGDFVYDQATQTVVVLGDVPPAAGSRITVYYQQAASK